MTWDKSMTPTSIHAPIEELDMRPLRLRAAVDLSSQAVALVDALRRVDRVYLWGMSALNEELEGQPPRHSDIRKPS